MSDWFHSLFGFSERSATDVHAKLKLNGTQLHSLVNDKHYQCGVLETPTLSELRARHRSAARTPVNCNCPSGSVMSATC